LEKELMLREILTRLLDAEKLKYCYECGICTASCPVVWIDPKHHNPRNLLRKVIFDFEEASNDTGLWMCMRCYRCHDRCPQRLDLPEIFWLIRDLAVEQNYLTDVTGMLEEVLKLIRDEIPLAAVYGWICLRPHEAQNKRTKLDKLAIDALERFVADRKKEKTPPIPKTRKEKIAIIGSGPAGLIAATELVKKGYLVTVFESLPEPGGMLRVGIPNYRFPKEALDVDINHIKKLGVEIETNVSVGKDVTIEGLLQEGYKAIFIATGAYKSMKLGIKGEELKGVITALDFLKDFNMGKKVKLGKRVVVIGGGNVAMDAATTALRLGAEAVQLACLESREEMPAHEREIQDTLGEGVALNVSWGPKEILGDGKKLTGVKLVRCLSVFDERGRFSPSFNETVAKVLEADTVILAVGQVPDLSFLGEGIDVLGGRVIAVDPMTMETSLPGVFAGGDVVSGPATVIEAIAAGRRAAVSIDCYLKGEGD